MNKIGIWLFMVLALIASMIIAVDIGSSDYEGLAIYILVGIAVYFLVNGWRNVWWFTTLLLFSGVMFVHGFAFDCTHLFVLMLGIASVLFVTSRGPMPQVVELQRAGSRVTAVMLGVLLAYATLHFFIYWAVPYAPTHYSVKSSLKAYFETFASMFAFFWMLVGPYGFTLKPKWQRTFLIIIALALVGNVAIRGYMFLQGFQAVDEQSTDNQQFLQIHIPIINLFPGTYTLRALTPLACVILLMVATIPNWWRDASNWMRCLIVLSVVLCYIGAIFSGGRATLPLCIAMSFMVAILRKRFGLIMMMICAGVLMVAVANMFSHFINTKAPNYIARSLQLVMIEKGDAYRTISGSQDVRNQAISQALVEWQADPRVMLFGRSVFYLNARDAEIVNRQFGNDGFVMNAVWAGRTHNLVTDLLLQYGLLGCVLYLVSYLVVIRYFWRLYGEISPGDGFCKALAGAVMLYVPPIFISQLIGGTFLPLVTALAIGLIRAHLVQRGREAVAPL